MAARAEGMNMKQPNTQDNDNQLSDEQLEQVTGGGLLSSPLGAKARPPITSWSGEPYRPVEDVEAY